MCIYIYIDIIVCSICVCAQKIRRVHQCMANSFRTLFKRCLVKEKYTNLLEAVQQKNDHATEILRKEMAPWWHSHHSRFSRQAAMKRNANFVLGKSLDLKIPRGPNLVQHDVHWSTTQRNHMDPRARGAAMLEKLHHKFWKFTKFPSDKHFTVGAWQSLFSQLHFKFFGFICQIDPKEERHVTALADVDHKWLGMQYLQVGLQAKRSKSSIRICQDLHRFDPNIVALSDFMPNLERSGCSWAFMFTVTDICRSPWPRRYSHAMAQREAAMQSAEVRLQLAEEK